MSTMQTEYGRVVDRRVDGAAAVGAMARYARRFFRMINRMPAADQAETVFWRQQAVAATERKRIDSIVRYAGFVQL